MESTVGITMTFAFLNVLGNTKVVLVSVMAAILAAVATAAAESTVADQG